MAINKYLVFFLAAMIMILSIAKGYAQTVDRYPFADDQQRSQFQVLINQLRCLVCQNQDLADSNADLAKDLRQQIYTMVRAGQSDQEIKQYLVMRYGNYILFKPPLNSQTYVLWLLPFILLIVGVLILLRIARRKLSPCK